MKPSELRTARAAAADGQARVVLVGELNPYGPDAEFALWPDPPGCAGWRLCRQILQMTPQAYLDTFDRVNLCTGRWSIPAARALANALVAKRRPLVLLGAKVALAFGVRYQPFSKPTETSLVLPHPSGRCTLWDTIPNARSRAREAVADLVKLLPPPAPREPECTCHAEAICRLHEAAE